MRDEREREGEREKRKGERWGETAGGGHERRRDREKQVREREVGETGCRGGGDGGEG